MAKDASRRRFSPKSSPIFLFLSIGIRSMAPWGNATEMCPLRPTRWEERNKTEKVGSLAYAGRVGGKRFLIG